MISIMNLLNWQNDVNIAAYNICSACCNPEEKLHHNWISHHYRRFECNTRMHLKGHDVPNVRIPGPSFEVNVSNECTLPITGMFSPSMS